jgi:hypothetical protein
MSAPWLILPLAFGYTQRQPGRAALAGLLATAAALTGFFAMTLSPVEGVALHDALAGHPGVGGGHGGCEQARPPGLALSAAAASTSRLDATAA